MAFIKQDKWQGVNKAVGRRDDHNFLRECRNADTNVVEGEIHLRTGYKIMPMMPQLI